MNLPNGKLVGTFLISIDDGFCEYQYEFKMSGEYSIDKIAKKIYEVFEVRYKKPKLTREHESKIRT